VIGSEIDEGQFYESDFLVGLFPKQHDYHPLMVETYENELILLYE
jgi:hypothetical protein